MKKNELLLVKEYAKSVSVTRQAVEKAILSGRIPADAVTKRMFKGKSVLFIDKEKADKNWVLYANPTGGTSESRAAVDRIKDSILSDETQKSGDESLMTYSEASRIEKVAKASIAQLELLELQGKLVRKDIVYRQLFDAGKQLRDAILSVPDRISRDIIDAKGDEFDIEQIMTKALTDVLEQLTEIYRREIG
jgi:uncharacterized membrane protein YkoI